MMSLLWISLVFSSCFNNNVPQETAILRYITLNYTRNLYLGADISQISQSFSWIHWAASVLHRYATMATMVTMATVATMATVVTMATIAIMATVGTMATMDTVVIVVTMVI